MNSSYSDKQELDDRKDRFPEERKGMRYSILSAVNAFLTIVTFIIFLTIMFGSMMGVSSSEKVLFYLARVFALLCLTGVLFTILSFLKEESPILMMWIAGFINSIFFMYLLFNLAEMYF